MKREQMMPKMNRCDPKCFQQSWTSYETFYLFDLPMCCHYTNIWRLRTPVWNFSIFHWIHENCIEWWSPCGVYDIYTSYVLWLQDILLNVIELVLNGFLLHWIYWIYDGEWTTKLRMPWYYHWIQGEFHWIHKNWIDWLSPSLNRWDLYSSTEWTAIFVELLQHFTLL